MRWINDRDVYCRCPVCGWVFPKGTEKLNACQHCGARMDEWDVCLHHNNFAEASEASYVQKHVMEIGGMNDKGGNEDE